MKFKIETNPLTVNMAWQGRRFKSKDYLEYEKEVFYQLPKESIKGEIEIHFLFNVKTYSRRDVDNMIKPLQDILVKAGVIDDDKNIVKLIAEKRKSKTNSVEVSIKKLLKG